MASGLGNIGSLNSCSCYSCSPASRVSPHHDHSDSSFSTISMTLHWQVQVKNLQSRKNELKVSNLAVQHREARAEGRVGDEEKQSYLFHEPALSREMIENTITQKPLKLSSEEHAQLTELLIAKDNELKATLNRADEQAKINLKMDALRAEVERQDQDIRQLQQQLKEAEQILATAIYQAKQKLQSIARANKRPVPSEELIKYAHRISASNAICAPLTWQQGDPRRPYPTDIEMRLGYLGRLSDLPLNGQMLGSHPGISSDLHRAGHPVGEPPVSQANQFAWHPSGEIHLSVSGQGSVAMNTHKQESEDVEVMSTDSSSSSSSDSQ